MFLFKFKDRSRQKPLPLTASGPSFPFQSGLQQTGGSPPTLGRATCFALSTDSRATTAKKHPHRHPRDNVGPNTRAPRAHVTHKTSHQSGCRRPGGAEELLQREQRGSRWREVGVRRGILSGRNNSLLYTAGQDLVKRRINEVRGKGGSCWRDPLRRWEGVDSVPRWATGPGQEC